MLNTKDMANCTTYPYVYTSSTTFHEHVSPAPAPICKHHEVIHMLKAWKLTSPKIKLKNEPPPMICKGMRSYADKSRLDIRVSTAIKAPDMTSEMQLTGTPNEGMKVIPPPPKPYPPPYPPPYKGGGAE